MKPYTITVVIEAPTEAIGRGHALLGGKVVSLARGDKIAVAEKHEPTEQVIFGKKHRLHMSGMVPPTPQGQAAQSPPEEA